MRASLPGPKVLTWLGLALVAAAAAWGAYALSRPNDARDSTAELSIVEALGDADGAGFAEVSSRREFEFPADHGPHPDYGVEWWYYTGNLDTDGGRHFGYQLTFFRIGLVAAPTDRESAWAASQVYMAHFALTDVDGGRFYSFERFARNALGLAGAQASPFRVWLEDWSAQGDSGLGLDVTLHAADGNVSIDLTLSSLKPVVLNGDQGFSRKSDEPGNASYYYSITRMPTSGKVSIGMETFQVTGASWMDREWSSSALAEDQVGWDWFALQLSDGRELMYYRLRRRGGGIDPLSAGTLVSQDGSFRSVLAGDVTVDVLETWSSPRGGAPYPSRWRVRVPSESLDLEITPYLADQEVDQSVRYWEGAVRIEGTARGSRVTGQGYVEMTGYAGARGGRS